MSKHWEKPFDIRNLFTDRISENKIDTEELDLYEKLEKKQIQKHTKNAILDYKILKKLKGSDLSDYKNIKKVENIESKIKFDIDYEKIKNLSKEKNKIAESDKIEIEEQNINIEWKIDILKGILKKDPNNVECRLKLSRLLEPENSKKLLFEALSSNNQSIWMEYLENHYDSDIFQKAINAEGLSGEYYILLFNKSKNIEALKKGVENNSKDSKIWLKYLENILEKNNLLDILLKSINLTHSEEIIKFLINHTSDLKILKKLYFDLRKENYYSDTLIIFLLNLDVEEVLPDLFLLDFFKIIKILEDVKNEIILPEKILKEKRGEIIKYLRELKINYMKDIPRHIVSLGLSISKLNDEEFFLIFYSVAKQMLLNETFILDYFNPKDIKYFHLLLKAKELWKLFKRTKNIKTFKKAEKCLIKGMKTFIKHKKLFILARSKMYYQLGDFNTAFLIIPERMKTIKKYIILSKIDLERAIINLESDLYSYKHYLLLMSLLLKVNKSIIKYYDECIKVYPNEIQPRLFYVRYLKTKDLILAEKEVSILLEIFKNDENTWYEKYVIFKKLKKPALSVLYNSRKYLKSDLLEMEIKYLENKNCPKENLHENLFLFKKIFLLDCNRSMICLKCKEENTKKFIDAVHKDQDNGDNYLILYGINGCLNEELKSLIDFFDPVKGRYWCRVRNEQNIECKLKKGYEMMSFDLLKY